MRGASCPPILPLLLVLLPMAATAAESQSWVPTPRGQILASSATNRPFLAADRARSPVDLAQRGYVEEEVLVSGTSSTYEWNAQGAVTERSSHVPWMTRLLVRRPADVAKFSGRVVLELLDGTRAYDVAPLWGLSADYFIRHGDAWAGLTIRSDAAAALTRFDPVRYGTLNFAPKPPEDCGPDMPAEAGLVWDMVSQSGALLRSFSRENPLSSLHARRVVLSGYGATAGSVATYAKAMHRRARLVGNAPVFEAYLAAASNVETPLSPCAGAVAAPARGAARDSPFVLVLTQSEVGRGSGPRRADSDARGEVFRLYEVSGASRLGQFAAGLPSAADLQIAGISAPEEGPCREIPSDFPAGLAFNAIWQQLDDYLVAGRALSRQPRIAISPIGTPSLDAGGNARGGWRLPQLEVPLAAYGARSTPENDAAAAREYCEATGSMRRYEAARLKQLYRDRGGWMQRFNAAVENAASDRRLTAEDAAQLKTSAAQTAPAF